ncbi:hypothetical protein [Mycobacteroides abscessus]|uniref:hypothetical protein n=1 Tax=Mycobacteroides abscessus TaxID=36809 RepID=UPI000C26838A|nr:hypothetical protein [Mycobacteroides abscessus]
MTSPVETAEPTETNRPGQWNYPDTHPAIRDHRITITQGNIRREYICRELWEETAAERDEFRRILALISALRVSANIRHQQLDDLLVNVGEDYASAKTMARLIADMRAEQAGQS